MSTFIWGPLMWDLLSDVAVAADQQWTARGSPRAFPSSAHRVFWSALQFVLPCKWCRQSYTRFLKDDPPAYPFRQWLWRIRNQVNLKLSQPVLAWEKFERRCLVSSGFSSVATWQDLCFILALNYNPTTQKKAYLSWFRAAQTLLSALPHLASSPLLQDPRGLPATALVSRFALLQELATRVQAPTEAVVRKYSHALSHQTVEELTLLCGPLLLQCRDYDRQCALRLSQGRSRSSRSG